MKKRANFQEIFNLLDIFLNDHYSTLMRPKHLLENQKCFLLWAAQRVFSNAGIVSKVSLWGQASEDEGVSVGRLLWLNLDALVARKLWVFFKPPYLKSKIKYLWFWFIEKVKSWIPIEIFVKFIYSEKATKFCEIFPLLLTTVHTVKS